MFHPTTQNIVGLPKKEVSFYCTGLEECVVAFRDVRPLIHFC